MPCSKELDRCLYFMNSLSFLFLLLQIFLLVTNHVGYLEVNQAALVEVVIGSPDILQLEVWPPMSRTQDPNTDWSHSLPKYPISLLLIMFPDFKEDEYTQFSGRTKHLMKYFYVSSETIFQQFRVFLKEELTQVFGMLWGKKCLGGSRVGGSWEGNALLHYLWWIDNNNCATLAGSWAKYVKRIAFIDAIYNAL